MPKISWLTMTMDHRAERLRRSKQFPVVGKEETPLRRLYVCAPSEVVAQLETVGGESFVQRKLTEERAKKYTHCFEFADGVSPDCDALVGLLGEVLTLRGVSPHVDFALALDWYKVVDDEKDAKDWANTDVGELVYRSKYWGKSSGRTIARRDLVDRLSRTIQTHPLLRDAQTLLAPAGSKADGESFGEQLASHVAEAVDKPFVAVTGTEREAQKEQESGAVDGLEFEVSQLLDGDVIVLDDVYRSGRTMAAAALAAKRSGADRVFGLAAARTMRS